MHVAVIAALALILLSPHSHVVDVLPQSAAAGGNVAAADVLQGRVQFVPYERLRTKARLHDVWLRFALQRTPDAPNRWAAVLPAYLALADFYIPKRSGGYMHYRSGFNVPYAQLEQPYLRAGAVIDVEATAARPIFVRVHLDPGDDLSLRLMPEAGAAGAALLSRLMLGLFFGVALAVGLANLYLAFAMRDRGALLFVLYIASIVAYAFTVSGVGGAYLWPHAALSPWVLGTIDALSFIAFLAFIRTFLSIRAVSVWLDRVLSVTFVIVALLGFPISDSLVLANIANIALAAAMLLTVVVAIIRALQRDFAAKIFLLGFVPVAVTELLGQVSIGWTIQVLILSLGVVQRIRSLSVEKQRTEVRNEELRNLAYFDPLTGALNRVAFDERLRTTIALARRFQEVFAVLFVDLDGFKAVNDSYGHQTGDEVLRIVASRLKGALRESDELARLGGDEFAIIAHTSPEGSSIIRDNVAGILATPVVAGGKNVDIGLSVGVAIFPENGSTPDALLSAADRDMYQMKQSHKRARLRSIS